MAEELKQQNTQKQIGLGLRPDIDMNEKLEPGLKKPRKKLNIDSLMRDVDRWAEELSYQLVGRDKQGNLTLGHNPIRGIGEILSTHSTVIGTETATYGAFGLTSDATATALYGIGEAWDKLTAEQKNPAVAKYADAIDRRHKELVSELSQQPDSADQINKVNQAYEMIKVGAMPLINYKAWEKAPLLKVMENTRKDVLGKDTTIGNDPNGYMHETNQHINALKGAVQKYSDDTIAKYTGEYKEQVAQLLSGITPISELLLESVRNGDRVTIVAANSASATLNDVVSQGGLSANVTGTKNLKTPAK